MTTNQDLIERLKRQESRAGCHPECGVGSHRCDCGMEELRKAFGDAIAALSAEPAPVAAESWQEWIDQNAETEPLLLNDWYVPVTKLKERLATLSPPPQSGDVADEAKLEEFINRVIKLAEEKREAVFYGSDENLRKANHALAVEADAIRSFFKRAAKGGEGMADDLRDIERELAASQAVVDILVVSDTGDGEWWKPTTYHEGFETRMNAMRYLKARNLIECSGEYVRFKEPIEKYIAVARGQP